MQTTKHATRKYTNYSRFNAMGSGNYQSMYRLQSFNAMGRRNHQKYIYTKDSILNVNKKA